MQKNHLPENLKNFFEADINFHWVLDEDGTILAINETVKQRLGYTEEDLAGKSVLLVHPAERQEEAARIVQAMLEGKERSCQVPIVSKRGEQIPVETYITKGFWNGKPALFGVSKDISELKLSQEKFLKIFNTSPNIIGLSELETGIYVEVNQAFYDTLGYSPEEVIGKRASDLVRFEEKYRRPIAEKLNRDGFVKEEEAVIYSKEGRAVPVLLSASVIHIAGKIYNLTIAVDITYRKMAENQMKESHLGLLELFDTMDVPVYIADPATYDLIYVNQALKKHFGEPDGKKCFQYLQNLDEPCSFCTNPLILGDQFGKTYSWEFQNRVTGRWYKCLDKALQWPDGRIVRYEMAFDITPQKEAEVALRESMDILNATQRLARIGGWEWNLQKNTMSWADETYLIHGFKPGEVPVGSEEHIQRSLDCYFPADRQAALEAFNRCVEEGKSYNMELPFRRADGRVIWVQTMANAVYEEGRIVKVIGNIIDITERQQIMRELVEAKERAEESNRLKSAFLASMSHEIRTPMNGILGFLQLLKEMDLTSEERDRFIEIVNKSGQRLLRTINDIIEMSKIEAGQVQLLREEIDLDVMMQFLLEFFGRPAREKGLALEWEQKVPGQHLRIFSDHEKLNSILTNLLNNAIKFTEHGDVRFGWRIEGDQLRFFVQDTGSGIPSDRIEAIFDRFTQGDLRLSSPHEGSGLGLSIAKAYCEKLGGTIGVDSAVGKGSLFFFTIPYEPVTGRLSGIASEDSEKALIRKGLTVLIAEDDDTSYEYLETILKKEGLEVVRTTDGRGTVETIKARPDIPLMLMDIRMGKMSGIEATMEIRRFNPSVVIIAQTAYALAGDREKALAAGCNDYIAKPVAKENLLKIIRSAFPG